MSQHRISDDGITIVCTASPEDQCRFRPAPECESETWGKDQCLQCADTHLRIHGQECWMIEWINGVGMLDDLYTGPGAPVTIYPGKAVTLDWNNIEEGVTWEYARGPNDHPALADPEGLALVQEIHDRKACSSICGAFARPHHHRLLSGERTSETTSGWSGTCWSSVDSALPRSGCSGWHPHEEADYLQSG